MAIVHLLSNSAAGSGRLGRTRRRAEAAVRAGIQARGHQVIDLKPASTSAIAPALSAAIAGGMSRLVIAGGDGLVHWSLPALANSGVPVGIVGIGTGNDFARALCLPDDTERAIAAALGDASPVDLIIGSSSDIDDVDRSENSEAEDGGAENTRNEHTASRDSWAATVVTGGFSGQVNGRADKLRLPLGQQRYTAATLLELRRLRPIHVRLDVDGEAHEMPATMVAVANTKYFGGGMAICPDARPDDGLLHITVIGPVGRATFARVLPTVFSGRHVEHPSVTVFRGREVDLDTTAALWADGEKFAESKLRVAPGALLVAGSLKAD